MNDKIIFIGGVKGSETTLLRRIINHHPSIKIGYENGFYKTLFDKYRDGIKIELVSQF